MDSSTSVIIETSSDMIVDTPIDDSTEIDEEYEAFMRSFDDGAKVIETGYDELCKEIQEIRKEVADDLNGMEREIENCDTAMAHENLTAMYARLESLEEELVEITKELKTALGQLGKVTAENNESKARLYELKEKFFAKQREVENFGKDNSKSDESKRNLEKIKVLSSMTGMMFSDDCKRLTIMGKDEKSGKSRSKTIILDDTKHDVDEIWDAMRSLSFEDDADEDEEKENYSDEHSGSFSS